MEFRVLGPIEFRVAEKPYEFRSAKERSLLAVLLLVRGRPVPVDTLINRVWGDTPPTEERQSLQTDIYRLRRMLRTAGVSDKARIVATPGAYALEVDPDCVDLFRSHSLREQAASIRRSGNPTAAAELLREAMDLWRSVPLTGITGEWFDHMRTSLDNDYRAMAQERVEVELAIGNHAGIAGLLVELLDRYPLDQVFIGQLMIAYYRCGRQTDAIGLYSDTRHRLRDETGTDPEPRLQTLYLKILRHAPSVAPPRPDPETRSSNKLPTPVADFTGRARELDELSDGALGGILAIEGMPGVGKSALAVKLAHDLAENFPDARIYLHLHAHDPQRPREAPSAALVELLRAVGVAPTQIPRDLGERAALWRQVMEGRRALIVLDDAADGTQVKPLLPGSPACHVIITTRRRLDGIDRVRHYQLGVLPDDDAAALFTRIAGSGSILSPDAVAKAARLCGRLPLAIGQAATRLRDRNVASIKELIDDLNRPHEDIAGLEDPVLAATFETSYRDLSPTQRLVFRRLGLSPAAELTAPAVAELANVSAAEAEQNLTRLVDHYLLECISPGRYQMHDLVRQYALARALQDESATEIHRVVGRALDHYLGQAVLADRALYPHHARADVTLADRFIATDGFDSEKAAKDWLTAESKNLVQLVQYAADHEWHAHVIELAYSVARYFDSASLWEEAEAIQQRALKVALSLELPRAVAWIKIYLSIIRWRVGQIGEAHTNASDAHEIGRRMRDPAIEAAALDQIGLSLSSSSSYREALAHFVESCNKYRENGNRHGETECLNHIGMMLAETGRHHKALSVFREALEIIQTIDDKRSEATILSNLANTYLRLGYHRDAYELFRRSMEIYQRLPGRRNRAILKNNLGDVARYRRRFNLALKSYREALSEYTTTGDRINEANTLNNIGATLSEMEKYNEALIHHKMALSIADETGNASEKIRAHLGIADTDTDKGEYSLAIERYRLGHRLARDIGDPYLEAQALTCIARVTELTEGHDAARISWLQAYDLFTQIGVTPEAEEVRIRLELTDLAN